MIDSLAATQAELLKSKELLEERIRQRTRELEIAMQRALAASQAKSEFLANMSHELRTPMNGVLGMMNIVLETKLNASSEKPGDGAAMRVFAARGPERRPGSLEDRGRPNGDRADSVRSADGDRRLPRRHSRPSPRPKDISLTGEVAPDMPAWVNGDPLRLRQILSNLLSNAVKFTEQGSVVLEARAG